MAHDCRYIQEATLSGNLNMPIYKSRLVNLIEGELDMFKFAEMKSFLTPEQVSLIIDVAKFAMCVNNDYTDSLEKSVKKCFKKI